MFDEKYAGHIILSEPGICFHAGVSDMHVTDLTGNLTPAHNAEIKKLTLKEGSGSALS